MREDHSYPMKKIIFLLLTISLLCVAPALAHKVNLFAYVEGGQIYSESYFPDGRPVKQGVIEIFSSAGKLLQQGLTDAEGLYVVGIPEFADLKLVVRASMGHQASFLLKQAELELGR